jgi:hypothetical protein
MRRMSFFSKKLYRRFIQKIGGRFYINPDPDIRKTLLVAGTARSGTTWLADLIASQIPSRVLFEPFNPDLVPDYRGFNYFQYIRPGTENPELYRFAQKIFTGKIRNRWVDRQNERIVSEYRLVKEIRANLILKWLHDCFPEVPIVFLVRHPCAVVASRMALNWATDGDIKPFLSQPNLISDYLEDYLDIIRNAQSDEEKHAIIWSVSNLIPLKQFEPEEIKVVFYENLCTQPEKELPALFTAIGQKYVSQVNKSLNQPSQTTHADSAVVAGTNKISGWQKKLSLLQIDKIFRIVQAFGLDFLYDKSLLPLKNDWI